MTTGEKPGARERLLETASRLFYAEGIHTVGIDRILEESGVAKASLYKTFGSKDALIAAYLEQRHELQKARVSAALASASTPRERILAIFDVQARLHADPTYRGCAFAAATAEGPTEGPIVEQSHAYRRYLRGVFRELAVEAGVADPGALACQLHMIYDGAQQAAAMDRDPLIVANARVIAATLVDAALAVPAG